MISRVGLYLLMGKRDLEEKKQLLFSYGYEEGLVNDLNKPYIYISNHHKILIYTESASDKLEEPTVEDISCLLLMLSLGVKVQELPDTLVKIRGN